MKTVAKAGSIAEFEVHRADGSIHKIGKLHNQMSYYALTAARRIPSEAAPMGGVTFSTLDRRRSIPVDGTFSVTDDTLTREAGTFDLKANLDRGDILYFGDTDEWTIVKSDISASYVTVYPALTVAPTTNMTWINATNTNVTKKQTKTTGSGDTGNVYVRSPGKIVASIGASKQTDPSTIAYTMRCMYIEPYYLGEFYYDLPEDVEIEIGDVIVLRSFEYTVNFLNEAPVEFANFGIAGLDSGPGRFQRGLSYYTPVGSTISSTAARAYLLDDANKITLNMAFNDANIAMTTLTPFEECPVGATIVTPIYNNPDPLLSKITFSFSTLTGGVTKQIVVGDTSRIFGIIEFDTPVNIPADRVISFTLSENFIPEFDIAT